jgi:hypothetical protein
MKPVQVIATTFGGTCAAIETAVPLAKGSGGRVFVLVPKIVPYPLSVDLTADTTELAAHKYRRLLEKLHGEGHVEVCLCRTVEDAIERLVLRDSPVVVGGPSGKWRMSPEERFANRLSRDGHRVIFASTGSSWSTRRVSFPTAAAFVAALLMVSTAARAQTPLQYGAFVDAAFFADNNAPANHLFRSRGTTMRVDDADVNMAAAYVRKAPEKSSRAGFELTVHGGQDAQVFGFSATAPNLAGADHLRYLGPTNISYQASVGSGLTVQGGIFSSLIGYDSLYAKDNSNYTRPWGADFTPYLMLGVNAAYPITARLTATGFVVNDYFHLAHPNDVPSFGGQLAFKASERLSLKQTVIDGPHQADTALEFWRFLSDTIVERKTERVTAALEYQIGSEQVADGSGLRAWWNAVQMPLRWRASRLWSLAVRPEFCWDSRGRWTGFEQSVAALTATLEYRLPYRATQSIVRAEYRVDDSRGANGGFFVDGSGQGEPPLTPTQHLFGVALIVAFDGVVRR